jgi:hypothetical protein
MPVVHTHRHTHTHTIAFHSSEVARLETSIASNMSANDWRQQLFRPHTDKTPVLETPIAGRAFVGARKAEPDKHVSESNTRTGVRDKNNEKNRHGNSGADKAAGKQPECESGHAVRATHVHNNDNNSSGASLPDIASSSHRREQSDNNAGIKAEKLFPSGNGTHAQQSDHHANDEKPAERKQPAAHVEMKEPQTQTVNENDHVPRNDDVPSGRRQVDVSVPNRRQIDVNIFNARANVVSAGAHNNNNNNNSGTSFVKDQALEGKIGALSSNHAGGQNGATGADPKTRAVVLETSCVSKEQMDGEGRAGRGRDVAGRARNMPREEEDSLEVSTDSLSDAVKVCCCCFTCITTYV